MARYISNWSGSYQNITGTGAESLIATAADLLDKYQYGSNMQNVSISSISSIDNTAITGNYYPYSYQASFSYYGSGFVRSSTPTVTQLNIVADSGWHYDFYGNVKVGLTGPKSGSISHVGYQNPDGERQDIYGSINVTGTKGSVTHWMA